MYSQVLVLRTTLGLLCILCAYFLGRGWARRDRPARRGSGPLGWAIRVTVTGLGVGWTAPFDWVMIATVALALGAGAVGYWDGSRPRRDEDLTGVMFPKD